MSRAAKATLVGSILISGLTVWGVHFMQQQERRTMHAGVERDEARQAEKRRQRALDLELNKAKEAEYQKMQPTTGWLGRRGSNGAEAGSQQSGAKG